MYKRYIYIFTVYRCLGPGFTVLALGPGFRPIIIIIIFTVYKVYRFCVFVAGWRHALRSEWPFIIIIIKVYTDLAWDYPGV